MKLHRVLLQGHALHLRLGPDRPRRLRRRLLHGRHQERLRHGVSPPIPSPASALPMTASWSRRSDGSDRLLRQAAARLHPCAARRGALELEEPEAGSPASSGSTSRATAELRLRKVERKPEYGLAVATATFAFIRPMARRPHDGPERLPLCDREALRRLRAEGRGRQDLRAVLRRRDQPDLPRIKGFVFNKDDTITIYGDAYYPMDRVCQRGASSARA